jgi:hypothetical protein
VWVQDLQVQAVERIQDGQLGLRQVEPELGMHVQASTQGHGIGQETSGLLENLLALKSHRYLLC